MFGVRPEDILISKTNVNNSFKAIIDIIEPMGREFEIHIDVGGKSLICVTPIIEHLNIGDEVYVTFNEKKLHLFDKKTGENILN
jgi:multiple sugar transport system ATP-binding protein